VPVQGHATDTESTQPGVNAGLRWPMYSGYDAAGIR